MKFVIKGRFPDTPLHIEGGPEKAVDFRRRLEIAAISVGRMPRNADFPEQYINGWKARVVVVTESGAAKSKIVGAELRGCAITSTSCREDNRTRGEEAAGCLSTFMIVYPAIQGEIS